MEIGLALGGGGARGIAHVGILKALEREKIHISAIAGTSIGGLVGATYLAGWSAQELHERFREIDQPKLYGHLKGEEPSLLGLAGGTTVLKELIGDITFADLPIPFAVTAVDLEAGQYVEIKEGRVLDAVLATVAVPGILPPRRWGNRLLVDGGVANPVPVDLARKLRPGLPVMAVVLSQPQSHTLTLPVPEIPGVTPVVEYISRFRYAQAFNIFLKSVDVGGKILAEIKLELDQPDLIIRPKLGDIGLLDNVDIDHLVHLGEEVVDEHLDDIKRVAGFGYRIQKLFGRK
ncbi:MAG: patatin-like phospholipase family protein [Anaerolineales bacterium]